MATCRSCRAEVIWAATESGKKMPLNSQAGATGNIVLTPGAQPVCWYVTADRKPPEGTPLYTSHFATCPQSRQWRRGSGDNADANA